MHRLRLSALRVEQKLSMAALFRQSPRLLMLHKIPASANSISGIIA